jgi:hypothetical protein
MARRQSDRIYQLKLTLRETQPPIWRRLLVPADVRLSELHEIIQIALGWTDSHMHHFEVDGEYFSDPDMELDDAEDEYKAKLEQVAGVKDKLSYMYDFGDSWDHEIVVEKALKRDPATRYPLCVNGAMACPPEDVGGVWGYYEMLEALKDPRHEQHDDFEEWIDKDFDPQAFDLEAVNNKLHECIKG